MAVQPYLFFDGRCEEAIGFYKRVLGAKEIMLLRWKDSPDPQMAMPGNEEKIMHARVQIGDATILASDGRCQGQPSFAGFALSYTATSPEEAERVFTALGEGGQVQMPLTKTFFSPSFGMLADKFGVSWMVNVEH
jgi:PhnB protein